MTALRISLVVFFIAAAMVLAGPPSARAQGLTVSTVATFDQPVEIPGHVLPAGRYEFVETGNTNVVVQIWDKENNKLVATLITNETEQPKFADRQEFEFDKVAPDSPAELKAWFQDAGTRGHEFIYDRSRESGSERAKEKE